MKLDFIKELYFHELDTKDQHDGRPAFQVAILSVLAGLLFFGYQHLHPAGCVPTTVSVALFLTAALCYTEGLRQVLLGTLNLGHFYERLPAADVMYDYYRKLQIYYAKSPDVSGNADDEFSEFLARHMVLATAHNMQNNLRRAARHYSAMRAFALTVLFAIAALAIVSLTKV
jgi:hypothetical protein